MDLKLAGKVAVISGGSVGIGLAIAEGLAGEGVQLALCARDATRVAAKAQEISDQYAVKAIGIRCDVTSADDITALVSEVEREFGGADILINNAGSGSNETIMEASDEQWQRYWELHVMATVRLARGLVPSMRQRGGGVILNNASICATQPLWYEPIYNVTKSALVMLSKNLANELIPDNIRVNAINAGLTLTPDWVNTAKALTKDKAISWEDYLADIAKQHAPINRFASPEEIANLFVFLCSPCASYCVGSTYYIDGGMLKVVT